MYNRAKVTFYIHIKIYIAHPCTYVFIMCMCVYFNLQSSLELSEATRFRWEKLQGFYCKAIGHVYAVATTMDPYLKYEWQEAEHQVDYYTEAIGLLESTWKKYKSASVAGGNTFNPNALIKRRLGRADQLARYVNVYALDNPSKGHSNTIVLDYWCSKVNDQLQLKAMTCTYLVIAASSISPEQTFSYAKHFLVPEHNCLGSNKLHTSVLVDSWSQLFSDKEILNGHRTIRLSQKWQLKWLLKKQSCLLKNKIKGEEKK